MKTIPTNMVPKLEAIGIIDPAGSKWTRTTPVFNERLFEMEYVCWCLPNDPKRVDMVPFEEGPVPIIIGQCSNCREVWWGEWVAKERTWTGRRTIRPARPMYSSGQGA